MIAALMLVFAPAFAWARVARANLAWWQVLLVHVLPLQIVSIGIELWRLVTVGRHTQFSIKLAPISQDLAIRYGLAELGISLALIFIGAQMVRAFGHTFRSRQTYNQFLRLTAYGLSPVFLLRALDGFYWANPWVILILGLVLMGKVLYQGVPLVLDPDPPQAFGLYVSSVFVLVFATALARMLSLLVLHQGHLTWR